MTHTQALFLQRYKTFLGDQDYPYDAIDAVLSANTDSLADVKKKVVALSDLKEQAHFEPLAIAFRRVVSILNEEADGDIQQSLFKEPAEKNLYDEYLKIKRTDRNLPKQKTILSGS